MPENAVFCTSVFFSSSFRFHETVFGKKIRTFLFYLTGIAPLKASGVSELAKSIEKNRRRAGQSKNYSQKMLMECCEEMTPASTNPSRKHDRQINEIPTLQSGTEREPPIPGRQCRKRPRRRTGSSLVILRSRLGQTPSNSDKRKNVFNKKT